MDSLRDRILAFFETGMEILDSIPPRKRKDIDGIEIVCVDNVNGRLQHNRGYCALEILDMIKAESKPIGMILLPFGPADQMEVKEFPGLNTKEQELLMHAFAEAQDERKEMFKDEEE